MASESATTTTSEFDLPPRKKPKISELPLSSVQRASIDGMLHTFKKKGEFDALRKKAFQQYNESAQRGMFEASLRTFTTNEIDRDPVKYLKPDRRIAAPLLEGAAARGGTYASVERDVEGYIEGYLKNAERALREIRRKEIGDEAAEAEMSRGNKSDEAYAAEADTRRQERAKKFVEDEKARKKQETQERKKKELEGLKKKQEELQKETERLQREQKRRAEREAWKAAEKEKERERIKKFNDEREKVKKEAEEREKAVQAERERRQKEKSEREQKRLEEEALDLLLKEGKQMAEKSRRPELERSESMEPPPRLKHMSAPRNNLSKEEMRSQGLMPTSLTLRKGDKPTPSSATPTTPAPGSAREKDREERDRPIRASRQPRSPSPTRSTYSRSHRRDPSPFDDDRRNPRRENTSRRETLYRDISAEREAWKARLREPARERDRPSSRGEEGEVVEKASGRARSRSRDRRRELESRSPPPTRRRERSRSRTPPRRRERSRSRTPPRRYRERERERDRSPPGKRERSRSPPGIDRYVPGGGGGGGGVGGGSTRRPRDEDEDRDRERPRDGDRDKDKERDRDRDRDVERRRPRREDDRPKAVEIDRYIPGSSCSRGGEEEKPARRRERSRSRSRERNRDRERERDKRERSRDREKDKEREREKERVRDKDRESRGGSMSDKAR